MATSIQRSVGIQRKVARLPAAVAASHGPPNPTDRMRIRTRNAVNLLGLESADWGQTPTEFQRNLYPERYRRGI